MTRDHRPLLFIDTNILLDAYRAEGSANFKLLGRLTKVKELIITSHQVEMEFQKNRQERLLEALPKLKLVEPNDIPGMLVESKELEELNEAIKLAQSKLKNLHKRLAGAFTLASNDPVCQIAKEIFSFDSPFNLTRNKPEYSRTLRLARRRFALGYPPRKAKDTSMGDAVNWEWIVECAVSTKRSVIVVSRDNDYGFPFEKIKHVNSWLAQEFIERVGHKAKLTLTDALAAAFKEVDVPVTEAERKAEEQLISQTQELTIQREISNNLEHLFSRRDALEILAHGDPFTKSAISKTLERIRGGAGMLPEA